jgi:hypothetical protein
MTIKGKRAKITNENNAMIMHYALETPRIPRTILAKQLEAGLNWEGPAPEIEVLERKISWFRNNVLDGPQEQPWGTSTLDQYPIPPESLLAVLRVWKSCIEKGVNFTIREAKWVSRLYAIQQDIEKLYFIATRHARVELMFEIMNRPFNSTGLDRLIMKLPVGVSNLEDFLPFLAEQREEESRGLKDGVTQLRNLQQELKAKREKGSTP